MFIDKNSLIINNINMGKYITSAKFGYFDTWSSDSGYNNLKGTFSGTLKGTYPKITIAFAKSLKKEDLILLTNNIFKTKVQTIVFDYIGGTKKTIKTHKGDLEINYKGINKHDAFSYSFVGNEPI